MSELHTDPDLLERLRRAAGSQLTHEQLKRQKVSFIMGSLGSDSSITRERIEQELNKLDGETA